MIHVRLANIAINFHYDGHFLCVGVSFFEVQTAFGEFGDVHAKEASEDLRVTLLVESCIPAELMKQIVSLLFKARVGED